MSLSRQGIIMYFMLTSVVVGITGCSFLGGQSSTTKPPSNNVTNQVESQAKASTVNHQIIYDELASLHDEANQWVGYNHTPKWSTWDLAEKKTYLPEVEKVRSDVAKSQQNATTKAVLKDLSNAQALLKIAAKIHQRQPLLYFHRIVSDLSNYVYSQNKGDEYFGATHALKGSEANTIDKYVATQS